MLIIICEWCCVWKRVITLHVYNQHFFKNRKLISINCKWAFWIWGICIHFTVMHCRRVKNIMAAKNTNKINWIIWKPDQCYQFAPEKKQLKSQHRLKPGGLRYYKMMQGMNNHGIKTDYWEMIIDLFFYFFIFLFFVTWSRGMSRMSEILFLR